MDEGQREQWWATFHQLMAELAGRARRRRSWCSWGLGAALAIAVVLLFAVSWGRFDGTAVPHPLAPYWFTVSSMGLGLVFVVVGGVLSWRAGTMGGPKFSPTAVLTYDQQRRCLALVRRTDPDDADQVEGAANLARRVSVQRSQGFFNAAFVLLMLSLVLDGDQDLLTAAILLALVLHLGSLVARELRVQVARRFLRAHGQPARLVPA